MQQSSVHGLIVASGLSLSIIQMLPKTATDRCAWGPLTSVSFVLYRLTIDPVVDFTSGYQSGMWSEMWEDFIVIGVLAGSTSASNPRAG
jgi:hypothetical protein